ncbi:MAG: 4-hydroxy-tetrahydrodipicolinate reductase [Candidatus Kapaibacteriales bacterium]
MKMEPDKPKLALVGYGKMGKAIESLAIQKGFTITNIFEIANPIHSNENYDFDVAIDFTEPKAVLTNIEKLAKIGKNIVIGTTGWYTELERVRSIVEQNKIGVVYSSNFLIGMNVLFRISEELTKLFDPFTDYDIAIEEIHHRHKKDAPSGTALKIAKIILENSSLKKVISTNPSDVYHKRETLNIISGRVGEIFGEHRIIFDSEYETLEVIHRAKSRLGFALGALVASKFIWKKTGLFEFAL